MNNHVYRILQLMILLLIAFFVYMIVQAVRNIGPAHDAIDVAMYVVSVICFFGLLVIMERDRKRDGSR
jgi:hypothetical protein